MKPPSSTLSLSAGVDGPAVRSWPECPSKLGEPVRTRERTRAPGGLAVGPSGQAISGSADKSAARAPAIWPGGSALPAAADASSIADVAPRIAHSVAGVGEA